MSETLKINLTPFISIGSGVLCGRQNGIYARMILKLDEVDQWVKKNQDFEIEFQFPESIWTVNDSFLKGLLQQTYRNLGSDTFVARVNFYSANEVLRENLKKDISNFISVMKQIG